MPTQDFTDDEQSFADWVYDNYINPSHHGNAICCSPNKWSIHELLMNDLPFTQNHAEAFHKNLNQMLNKSKTDLIYLKYLKMIL